MATGKDADYFREKLGETAPRSVIVGSEDAFFCELDAAGVRTAVAPSGNNLGMTLGHRKLPPRTTSNDEQALLQAKYPNRFIGVAPSTFQTRRMMRYLNLSVVSTFWACVQLPLSQVVNH